MSSRPPIGLACAGGVVEGAFYEVGALSALEEAVTGLDLNRLSAYVGVSSGSVIGTFLAAGVPISTMSRAAAGEADAEFRLGPETLFRPAWSEFGRRMRQAPGVLAKAAEAVARQPGEAGISDALVRLSSLVPAGFFDNAAIERFVADVLAHWGVPNRFSAFEPALRVVAVDVDTAETACFGIGDLESVPVSRAVQASTALPVLYRPVTIDGRCYIDGVARRTVHASRAFEAGAKLVFCLNPIVPVNLRASASGGDPYGVAGNDENDPGTDDSGGETQRLADSGLPLVLSQTFRTLVHSRLDTGFRAYKHRFPDADAILIEPRLEERALFFSNIFSFSNRRAVCELAYDATRAWLLADRDTIEPVLARHGLSLDLDVLRDDTRTLYGAGGPGATRRGPLDQALESVERLLVQYA